MQAVARGTLPPEGRLPTVRALAQTLGVHPNTVARAYTSLVRDGVLAARPGRGTFVARVREDAALEADRAVRLSSILARALVEAESLGYSPEQIEAGFSLRMARFRQETSKPTRKRLPSARALPGLVVMGSHDLALDQLVRKTKGLRGPELTSTHTGSMGGLIALARGEANVAGCHLLDEDSGEYNLPFVRRVLPGLPVVVVTLVGRSQGLLVPRGNPKQIGALEDVVREDVRFINRQRGSGTRVLLDFLLRRIGRAPQEVRGYDLEVDTHIEVAAAVASHQADVGLGILAAARALDLDFIPLQNERYDLVVPLSEWHSPKVKSFRRTLDSREFKDSVHEMGGYDTSHTGMVVAQLTG